jgi:hypothetical protein
MKRSKYLIFLILLFLISNGCSQPLESNSNSKLLYISGKYLSFGAFGDVKIITETSLEEGSITSDRVYDYSPFLMDSNTVLFLTKRDKSDKGLGLGKSNQLYTYNLNTKKLHDLKIDGIPRIDELLYVDARKREILIYTSGSTLFNRPPKIFIANYSGNLLKEIILPNYVGNTVSNLFLNDNFYLFEYYNDQIYGNELVLYDRNRGVFNRILRNKVDEELGNLSSINCNSGSFINETDFLFSCSDFKNDVSSIFRFSISEDSFESFYTNHKLKISNIHFAKEFSQIYFIGSNWDSKRNDRIIKQIFSSNLFEIHPQKITKSQTNKEGLRVYRP